MLLGAIRVSGHAPLQFAVAVVIVITDLVGATTPITVVNDSAPSGLNGSYQPDQTTIPIGQWWMGGGVAIADFDKDGWPDVFTVGGGLLADRLYINNHDGTFTNQASAWGVAALHGGMGCSVADFNKDGWLDIYVTSYGSPGQAGQPGKHRLYKNNGNGTFTDVAVAAGVNFTHPTIVGGKGSAWGDLDLDGDLDLFVCHYKDTTGIGNGGSGNRLFRNNGDGTFTNITSAALSNTLSGVWGFQPAFVDMDGNLFPELLIAADFKSSRYVINDTDGTFTNFSVQSGTCKDNNGMGQTVADFNRDGLLDWYVTSIYIDRAPPTLKNGNTLYYNQGNNLYVETADAAGVDDGGWGWGTLGVDLDNDGWTDIVEVNGRDANQWANEQEYVFHNNGDGTYATYGSECGLDLAGEARGLAWLDADHDGDVDFVITTNKSTMRYYRNDSANSNRWMTIYLNTTPNPLLPPNGFGSHVKAAIGETSWVQYMSGMPSYLSTSDLAVHFGFGAASSIDQLEVRWPRGQVTTLTNVAVDQILTINAPIPADITGNGVVDVNDLLQIINSWGPCPAPCAADPIGNGVVDVDDLLNVINNWG